MAGTSGSRKALDNEAALAAVLANTKSGSESGVVLADARDLCLRVTVGREVLEVRHITSTALMAAGPGTRVASLLWSQGFRYLMQPAELPPEVRLLEYPRPDMTSQKVHCDVYQEALRHPERCRYPRLDMGYGVPCRSPWEVRFIEDALDRYDEVVSWDYEPMQLSGPRMHDVPQYEPPSTVPDFWLETRHHGLWVVEVKAPSLLSDYRRSGKMRLVTDWAKASGATFLLIADGHTLEYWCSGSVDGFSRLVEEQPML